MILCLRYCSLSSHYGKELGCHDDMICLLHMMEELMIGLPWRFLVEKDDIMRKKQCSVGSLFKTCPQLFALYVSLNELEYGCIPDYTRIKETMQRIFDRRGYLYKHRYDWEAPKTLPHTSDT